MTPLILASGSSTRAEMLRNAGVSLIVDAAEIDEAIIKERFFAAGRSAIDAAVALAEAKAVAVSARRPGSAVLGADQMLEVDGVWLNKPRDRAEAAAHLARLRGRAHHLETAAVLVRDGTVARRWTDRATLHARDFSDAFIEWYLDAVGDDALWSVGAYQIEGLGIRLFERIEGDHFTILGLPLLPIINHLADSGSLSR